MTVIFVYITAPSRDEATHIGQIVVEERLAACVNIFGGMTSIYRWQGAIESAQEVVMIAKTQSDLFESLAARVRALHSYTTPCIVELPIGRGDAGYLDWLAGATASGGASPSQ